MSQESYLIGKAGEDLAEKYLAEKGYQIIERNFRARRGEIDMVAFDQSCLAFVEVKNYSFNNYLSPLDSITHAKKTCLIHAAKAYLYLKSLNHLTCRFDVLIIFSNNGQERRFLLIKNAFQIS
ncbi:MAG: YraN family protein [Candidatus Margulisiibacteriota bacterium]